MPTVDLGRIVPVAKGAWSSGVAYERLDIVSHGGGSFIAKQAVPAATATTNTAYWTPLAAKGDTGAAGAEGPQGSQGPQGGSAITFSDSALSEDVALAANNTWYDGPSVTLAAGTWMVNIVGHYRRGVSGASNVAIRAWDGVAAYAHAEVYHPSVTNVEVNPATFGIAVLASESTVTLQMLTSAGNAAALMKAATASNGQGNIATRITAIKLA